MGSIYTVLQINKYIKNMIDQDFFLGNLQVQGEVSNCKYHSSGHIYFTLKDKDAAISCVMFAGNRAGLAFSMQSGDKVVVSGSISAYEKAGTYQLYAKKIEKMGMGDLYEKYLALKKELEEMGMFAPEYKKPIPKHVKKLGIVTAATGAAIRDINNIAKRRNPGIQLILCPALVQGEGAKESLVRGIQTMDRLGVDVMIVGRGGGSIEDLWAFNEECVARAVFDCNTPVISAVGHETDFTIADFTADMRAPTPSAAAELAVENIMETIDRLERYRESLGRSMDRMIKLYRLKNEQYKKRVEAFKPSNIILGYRQKLKVFDTVLRNHMESALKDRRHRLKVCDTTIRNRMDTALNSSRHRLQLLCGRLEDLSPLKRLSGGFSYVSTVSGTVVRSVKDVETGDMLEINVKDGAINAKVEEIHFKENAI